MSGVVVESAEEIVQKRFVDYRIFDGKVCKRNPLMGAIKVGIWFLDRYPLVDLRGPIGLRNSIYDRIEKITKPLRSSWILCRRFNVYLDTFYQFLFLKLVDIIL